MNRKIDLEIIITTYNSQFWLKKTLLSLQDQYLKKSKFKIKTTVVDNKSTDDTIKVIKRDFKWVNLIELEENHGFAYANNRAIEKSKARYVMLLNSDVEFTEHSNLDPLLRFMNRKTNVGVITPKLVFTDGKLDTACHRGEPTPWASFTYLMKLEALLPKSEWFGQYHQFYKDLNSIHTIDACSGAAMIARRSAIKKIGLLDERFFMYAEDLDWCKRFREANYLVVYHPGARLIHHKNKSGIKSASQDIARKTKHHFFDTMLQYYDKHYHDRYPSFVRTLIRYFTVIKKGAL